jgi:CO/xanthine dehydrogenase FAD-binding subunit
VVSLFRPREYLKPKTIDEAVSLLVKYGEKAKVIAGGTDLLVEKPPESEYLIDIAALPLDYIDEDQAVVKIGALTTFDGLEKSALLQEGPLRVLAEAARDFGHRNVRNLATIGGNLCSAVPSADAPPPLIALDSEVVIYGPSGESEIPLEKFFVHVRRTVLKGSELLKEIKVPIPSPRTGITFLKIGRTRVDIALVNVAVSIRLRKDGVCEDARIVLGAVAPTPIRLRGAEALLRGKKVNEGTIEEAADIASRNTKPISDVRSSAEYRTKASMVLVKRAITKAWKRAELGG